MDIEELDRFLRSRGVIIREWGTGSYTHIQFFFKGRILWDDYYNTVERCYEILNMVSKFPEIRR